ncbi:hypothetical protein O181_066316 [Austropuccinia psidii MF-1]|uniref:Uncharacterized protein n=1 Tax=Austropuccinia psidii MF-1 TaxID=1389203 RepID=A0A9Q3I238_9BASI|nr:hypothetical protein [Austropuccinia psidii MF-1]
MINEIQFVKSSIDVELGKFDSKSNKITSDINYLKKNERISAYWHKLKTARLESISNRCDIIESKYQVQDDVMEDIFITNINDQLEILKNHFLEIFDNTNLFATKLARSDSKRQNLKDEMIAHVKKIHNNDKPNSHMPRLSTPLTEEKHSVKGRLAPFLGENAISEKDIPKLEQLLTFSGEGKYNHIEFIRTIDMSQEDFHIPAGILVGKLHSLFT